MSSKKRTEIPAGVSVSELLSLIPEDFISELADNMMVDKWVRKLKAGYLFKLVLYSLLNSERLSLRIMEDNYTDPLFRALAPALEADEVTWTGIRERLIKVNSSFFRQLYKKVYEQAKALYGQNGLRKYNIRRYDSTMIATFSHLLEGMKVGNTKKGKRQVKLTTEFTSDFQIRMEFHDDQAHLSEETALKEVVQNAENNKLEDIHVFDKGLKSRKTFEEFDADNISFVTRINGNSRYDIVRPMLYSDSSQDTQELEFIEDNAVKLYKSGHSKPIKTEFRLIKYFVKKKRVHLFFLTNLWDLEAQEIAHIYKQRWEIEVLFRFMKQEMNLTHFVCNDKNAIQVMLYCTMITTMLVLIYKKQNNIKSYKKAKIQFFKELNYFILLEILEQPNELIRLKKILKSFLKKE